LKSHSSGRYDLEKEAKRQCFDAATIKDPKRCTILDDLSGFFDSGELTGIMGPSGAGKTTLVNILSHNIKSGFSGQIKVQSAANFKAKKESISINTIPQNDCQIGTLTVRENLMYASRLKNVDGYVNHEKKVSQVSSLLGLDDCLDTKTKNTSGGQQKRLSIAQELLSQPDILVLDEPTSGLDSSNCIKTLTVLRDLVRASRDGIIHPIAIVLTIHQPQLEAFNMFDRVYVMATGGHAIYNGPPSRCVGFIEGSTKLCLPSIDYNPGSFVIEIASSEFGQEPISSMEAKQKIEHRKELSSGEFEDSGNEIKLMAGYERNEEHFMSRTRVLVCRILYTLIQDKLLLFLRTTVYLFVPTCLAMVFGKDPGSHDFCPRYSKEYKLSNLAYSEEYVNFDIGQDIYKAFENMGLIFVGLNVCLHVAVGLSTLFCSIDLRSSLTEIQNGWYSRNCYLCARILSNIPVDSLVSLGSVILLYVLTGQAPVGSASIYFRIFITACALMLGISICQVWGIISSVLFGSDISTAIFISEGLLLPSILMSGFTVRVKAMPKVVGKLTSLSLHNHMLNIAYIGRYGWDMCACKEEQISPTGPTMTGVPEKLKQFIHYWQASEETNSTGESADVFSIIAQQVSRFNCFGADVKSCKDLVPFVLTDADLKEEHLRYSFLCLALIMIVSILFLAQLFKTRIVDR